MDGGRPGQRAALPLLWANVLTVAATAATTAATTVFESTSCPCANLADLIPISNESAALFPDLNVTAYGIGCGAHDIASAACDLSVVDPTCVGVVPTPAHCTAQHAWCSQNWCYVDKASCALTNEISDYFPGQLRYYSYGACGFHDDYASGQRKAERLRGRVLRVGMRRNSGGWQGAYHPHGHGERDELWSGPAWDLFTHMANASGFIINITEPPDGIKDNSGSGSSFSQCVYATALGYLDACVAMFTMTEQRVSWTSMGQIEASPLYVVAFAESDEISFMRGIELVIHPFRCAPCARVRVRACARARACARVRTCARARASR